MKRHILGSFTNIPSAHTKLDSLYDAFLKAHKRKPSVELWLSIIGTGKKTKVDIVCYYKDENLSELEYYKTIYE